MASVADDIREWASSRPYWERAALCKIASGKELETADYEELLDYLLRENDLADDGEPLPQLPLDSWETTDGNGRIRLVSISDLRDVNALVPGQRITFGPALTVMYGENASGKSGYARVLGCAGFTRGDKEVLPDVNKPAETCGTPTARIEIEDSEGVRALDFSVGSQPPELASFHVFDSTSVLAHITKSHSFSFTPGSLALLPKLAEITDEVRRLLHKMVQEREAPHDLGRLFEGESEVATLIRGLNVRADFGPLDRLAQLGPAEGQRKSALEKRRAELVLSKTGDDIKALETVVNDLGTLAEHLALTAVVLGDTATEDLMGSLRAYDRLRKVAESSGAEQFANEGLSRIGSGEWQEFALSAKALADAESGDREPYPVPGDICLLCHQPLSAAALDLLRRLWVYLSAEASNAVAEADGKLDRRRHELANLKMEFFEQNSVAYRHVEQCDRELLEAVTEFVNSAVCRRQVLLQALDQRQPLAAPGLAPEVTSRVTDLAGEKRDELERLRSADPTEEMSGIEGELRLLEHRNTLCRNLGAIKGYVENLRWAKKASECAGSTRAITDKYNDLFEELVAKRYLDRFQKTLQQLGCPMSVRIVMRGQKGKALKRIALKVEHDDEDVPGPEKVLSEGEKRAVALADFLTEVSLDEHSCGIVVDDPVTSLDHKWKGVIAACLVEEAKQQQVIAFTHDLHFLWMLHTHSEEHHVELKMHWIERGSADDRPGYVHEDNCPALEGEYRTSGRAREWCEKAKKASGPEESESMLRQGFGALRTSYEVFVVFDMFQGVVQRWEERISLEGKLQRVVVDEDIVNTVVRKVGELSRFIEGHSHSNLLEHRPSPDRLQAEITAFDELKARQKQLVKERKSASTST